MPIDRRQRLAAIAMKGAGMLRERVIIQQDTPGAVDAVGGPTASWSTLATVWAWVVPTAGSERLGPTDAVTASAQYDVTIRYRADVTPKMRLSWTPYGGSAKTLQILVVQPVDRAFTLLRSVEVVR